MERMRCTSCNIEIKAKTNFVIFDCPYCGEEKIVRCNSCKASSTKYTCPKCGFTGP
ncbi:MAG: zinc finger domain-containing protein [Candidatus Aenigmarchaeota archaeon]|nr:zinc finger domain-containing protein [Candidatus Aenigmarchaeota archaeon]MCX8190744.1 zinc finger domain-containing protein [Candidatus Aenigmarchaeota archaeon]MDW8159992.1 zinc finger domain-containing protein [Candidatus Aenigmarchaeota archaeon]